MTEAASTSKGSYKWLVLAMLLLVYIFNFLDRQVLGILAKPIIGELGLTDTQFGILSGPAFAALYSILAVPLALLADRAGRTWVITVSLAIWSGFTALCGLATNFWTMLAFRAGVGVGEAGGVAPSYALIGDYFPVHQRAKALAIYSLGIPVGLGMGALIGGYIAATVNWRTAFVVLGIAGIAIAPLFRLVVRDVPRSKAMVSAPLPMSAAFRILAPKPSFWLLAFGAACSSMCGYGLAAWVPSVLIRSFQFDLLGASQFIGSLLLTGGVIGVFAGGWLADKIGPGNRAAYALLPAAAWLVTWPLYSAGLLFSTSPVIAWLLLLIPNGLNILWLGPINTAIQNLVPANMRATASASFLLINNLIGLGAGPFVMGALSDALKANYGTESLRYALLICLTLYLVAAVLALIASRHLKRDWHEGLVE